MQTKRLGNSDLDITPIGVGAWAMGGPGYRFSWGDQDDSDSIAAIHRALDLGINWIDTAAVYGLGHSEEVVAKALHGMADRPYVFTKCERVWDENREISKCLKRESIRREIEASLGRLKMDCVDLYQIHWAEPEDDLEEGWSTLVELKSEGKVRHIGVCNFNVSHLKRAQAIAPITSLQPPYSLLRRGIEEEILPYALGQGIGVIGYSPMASGLLTGTMTAERAAGLAENDWRSRSDDFKEPKLSKHLALSVKLAEVASRHGRTAGEAAIAWTLRHPAVTGSIVGIRRPDQIEGLIGAMTFRLSNEETAEVEAVL
ncbi:MAG: aldo/keto reductase [Fimbriimonas sp.]|nr:aldo/keto reductase [Fimbriimonas sp.]